MSREGVNEIRRYSESMKLHVVEEVESGRMSAREASNFYDIGNRRTVYRWVRKYGKSKRRTKVVRVIMKSELERIRELESALSDALLGRRVLMAQLDYYEENVPDIKKKLSSQQLKEFEERQKKIEQFR